MITDPKDHCTETSSRNGVLFQNFYSQLNLEFVSEDCDLFTFLSLVIQNFFFVLYVICIMNVFLYILVCRTINVYVI